MKEKINEKMTEVTNYILEKNVKDITIDGFNILNVELTKIEFEESKEQRDKNNSEMIEAMTKVIMNRS